MSQPYVSWKGPSTNSVVPIYSFPKSSAQDSSGPSFKARPIKHWRKQLLPNRDYHGMQRTGVGMPMDLPAGSIYLGDTAANTSCLLYSDTTTQNSAGIKENTERYGNTNFAATTSPSDLINNPTSVNCVACNPEANIIRRATTVLNKNYYSDTKAYLRSRCVLYDQKLTANKVPGIAYVDAEGQPLYPTNSPTGPQVRQTDNCNVSCTPQTQCYTIHKPNNIQFYQQGAVQSSTRIEDLKRTTIQNSASSFRPRFGNVAAAAGAYHASSDTPYFVKSQWQNPPGKPLKKFIYY
jgi:hypothetical protein